MKYYKIRHIIDSDDTVKQKTMDLFLMLLKPQQREILECIPIKIEDAVSCKDIKKITGIDTKNISSQIKQLYDKFPLGVIEEKRGYRKYFRKA